MIFVRYKIFLILCFVANAADKKDEDADERIKIIIPTMVCAAAASAAVIVIIILSRRLTHRQYVVYHWTIYSYIWYNLWRFAV